MMWRGSGKGWPTSVQFLATADQWQGPYNFSTKNLFPAFTSTHIEDAHMSIQHLPSTENSPMKRTWHAVFHSDVENKCNGEGGGHAWSDNGFDWTLSPFNAYCNAA